MKVVQHRDSILVYGMVLSAVFRHLGIDSRCDTPFLQNPSTYLDEHSLESMGYVKEQNIWVKKAERGTIDPDEIIASSSIDFDTRSALEAILGHFDRLDTRFESITTR